MRSDINLRSQMCIYVYVCMYISNICVNAVGSQTRVVRDAIRGQTRERLIGWEETESYVNLSCIHSILSPYRISARNEGKEDDPKTWKGKVANLCTHA